MPPPLDPETVPSRPRHLLAVRLTSITIVTFLCVIAIGSLITEVDNSLTVGPRVVGALTTVAAALCFLVVQDHLLSGRWSGALTTLAVGVVVLGLISVQLSDTWISLGILVATAMLAVGPRWWFVAGGAVWLLGVTDLAVNDHSAVALIAVPVTTLATAAALYMLTQLAVTVNDANNSREELARLSVDDERKRISRDLHDIMGRTLVAASLRNQTALQLLDRDPERARDQLNQLHQTIAQGQAQLRGLTSGPVVADLADELASAKALCTRLGVESYIETVPVADEEVSTLAGVIVREAVTNMLKHSSPQSCEVRVWQEDATIHVMITNDGAGITEQRILSGTGLADLQTRLEARGGMLKAGPTSRGRFRVLAQLPCRAPIVESVGQQGLAS